MSYAHHMIASGIHGFEWARNAQAGGIICVSNTSITAGFGGFGASTGSVGGEVTVTWRTDIATNSTPVIHAVRMAATTDDERVWRGVQLAGVGPTSAAIWFLDRGSASGDANSTVNGTAHVLIQGPFTGTRVT